MKFGEILISLGYVTEEKIKYALEEQEYNLKSVGFSEPIGLILLRNGLIDETQLNNAVKKYFEILSEDFSVSESLRNLAYIAVKALENDETTKLSHESKTTIINKILELEEKISIIQDSSLENKEKIISNFNQRIEKLKADLQKFA
ncbi:MAG: hypothetical protein N2258_00410 [Brevinematales bacterium]|nr:hypothetical protein [Brevinematales bacterium]